MRKITTTVSKFWNKFIQLLNTYPVSFFFVTIVVLFILIILGSLLRKPAIEVVDTMQEPKNVSIFQNRSNPSVTMQAVVEKSGVITIVAQTNGIVQKISVTEGMHVGRGKTLLNISTNYQGGSATSVARQIAQKSASFANETYDLQKSTIQKQKEIAEKQSVQAGELREINRKSIDDTKTLLTLTEDIVSSIDQQIQDLEATNVGGSNDSSILAAKQGKSAALAALNGLRVNLRTTEYSSSDSTTPAQLGNLGKDVTLQQLSLQEKSLDLSKDLANLQLKLARVTEGLQYPTTPCPGIVERVFVKVGQNVNPGTPLAVIRADERDIAAVVQLPSHLATQISRVEPSQFTINGEKVLLAPQYVSVEPTVGALHTATYTIPGKYEKYLANGGSILVEVPVGSSVNSSSSPFIPLDAVYQTQEDAYVYVVGKNPEGKEIAQVRKVSLGEVVGSYVTVVEGIDLETVVITTRSVSDGDLIQIK